MASAPVRRASVCLTCGDKGETTLLIYCRKCQDFAVHHYCMDNFSPDDDNINWWCWDCAPKGSIAEPLRKSERISSKKQKVLKTRNYWKERLNQYKRLVQISNGISETGQLTIVGHMPIGDMETQLLNERQRDQDILEEKKSIPEIPNHSEEHNESIKIDEPTFTAKSTLPLQEENNMKSFDETQKIQEVGQKKSILVLNNIANSEDEGKTIDLQVSSVMASDHCLTSDTLCGQPSLDSDHCLSAEPVIDPIWRGWFNIKEESETYVEILAHLSNKACLKVSDAATALPPMLDIQVLDKCVAWPKCFMVSPPTAASIALYFFPARESDERVFDSLLDEVTERDLALKAMINSAELLIFSSCELPLPHWRYNSKYFLWGVFRQKQHSHSSTETATAIQRNSRTEFFGLSEPTVVANNKVLVHSESADHLNFPSQPNRSPLSMNSSQASNVLPSKQNTPDSIASPSFKLSRLDKVVEQDNWLVHKMSQREEQILEGKSQASNGDSREQEEKLGCFVESENHYKSWESSLRPFPNTDNASAAEVV
ncbi:hypothetical protein Pfo_008169 [Paulownia fortunei]|nr:hypothetical protein Pfo_008169 [Paulownia fortunei]